MTVEVNFSSKDLNVLSQEGLQIPSLLGNHRFHDYSKFNAPLTCSAVLAPDNWIEIDAFTGIYGGRIGFAKIGRYCSIAAGVDIASDQHPTSWLTSSMTAYVPGIHEWDKFAAPEHFQEIRKRKFPNFVSNSQTVIGNDVWIGQGVFIKSGVRIGNGAIIGAHSVVVKDVPDYGIVVGAPARVIKYRFPEKTIEQLLELKWWEYSIYDFENIDFTDVEQSIEAIQKQIEDKKLTKYMPKVFTPLDIKKLISEIST